MLEVRREGRLVRVALNRPEKRNALDSKTCHDLVAAFEEANGDPGAGAVLLEGAGKAFCAGMDLKEVAGTDLDDLAAVHERLFTSFDWMAKPLIAAVQGPALAGGTGLAANAHIVIAEEDASFGLTEIRIGLWPVLIFPAMVAAMGERSAVELALTGRIFDAREAARLGLVTQIVAAAELAARASEVARAIAESSASAIRYGLEYCRQIRGKPLAEASRIGQQARKQIMRNPDFAEGLAAFHEKRQPMWPSQ